MADYIDRETLIDNLQKFAPDCYSAAVNNVIMGIPKANVAPSVYGHWIEYPQAHYFKCSKCKCVVPYKKAVVVNGKRRYNYCPNCGAKMDEYHEPEN